MSLGTQNIQDEFRERQYAAYHDQSIPPFWFRPKEPTYTGPTAIVFPGTLTGREQLEVREWLAASDTDRPNLLTKCTQRAAIAKITEYIAYYADPSWLAWRDTREAVRIVLWRLFMADTSVQSKGTISASADVAGAGSGPTTAPILPAENVAD